MSRERHIHITYVYVKISDHNYKNNILLFVLQKFTYYLLCSEIDFFPRLSPKYGHFLSKTYTFLLEAITINKYLFE